MSETVAQIIKSLGGPLAVSSRLSVEGDSPSQAAVGMWATRNEIPWKWRAALDALLTEARAASPDSAEKAA